jgi:surface polysaccharide O-acyltransferase-like enzyme
MEIVAHMDHVFNSWWYDHLFAAVNYIGAAAFWIIGAWVIPSLKSESINKWLFATFFIACGFVHVLHGIHATTEYYDPTITEFVLVLIMSTAAIWALVRAKPWEGIPAMLTFLNRQEKVKVSQPGLVLDSEDSKLEE